MWKTISSSELSSAARDTLRRDDASLTPTDLTAILSQLMEQDGDGRVRPLSEFAADVTFQELMQFPTITRHWNTEEAANSFASQVIAYVLEHSGEAPTVTVSEVVE